MRFYLPLQERPLWWADLMLAFSFFGNWGPKERKWFMGAEKQWFVEGDLGSPSPSKYGLVFIVSPDFRSMKLTFLGCVLGFSYWARDVEDRVMGKEWSWPSRSFQFYMRIRCEISNNTRQKGKKNIVLSFKCPVLLATGPLHILCLVHSVLPPSPD